MANILVVDDDSVIRDLLKDVLSMQGHTTVMADSGAAALEQVRKTQFDLVILDRNMPLMSGIQVLKSLRSHPATSRLKVIMCTAAELVAEVDEAFEAGAVDYLLKPMDMTKLIAKVALHTQKA
mgnify:FL=1